MPFSGSGTFSPYTPGNPVVSGTTISSSAFNNTIQDIATGLTNAITRDGQSPATANIPMGGNKLTGLAAASANGDAVRYEQLASYAPIASPTFTGTVTLPTVSVSGPTTSASTAKFDDVTTYRAGAPTTGFVYFGNTGAKFFGYDGTNFSLGGGALYAIGTGLTGTAASLTAGAATTDNQHYGIGMSYTAPGKSIGIGYTNSSNKLRKVSLYATSAVGGNNWWIATVAGNNIAISNASVSAGSPITLQFEVPPGAAYSVAHGSGSTPAAAWFEA